MLRIPARLALKQWPGELQSAPASTRKRWLLAPHPRAPSSGILAVVHRAKCRKREGTTPAYFTVGQTPRAFWEGTTRILEAKPAALHGTWKRLSYSRPQDKTPRPL
ncbi:hypothetical protein P7K49_032591, partial [Saguinus oedipus]